MHLLEILIDLKACQAFSRFKMAIFYFICIFFFCFGLNFLFFAVVVVF